MVESSTLISGMTVFLLSIGALGRWVERGVQEGCEVADELHGPRVALASQRRQEALQEHLDGDDGRTHGLVTPCGEGEPHGAGVLGFAGALDEAVGLRRA